MVRVWEKLGLKWVVSCVYKGIVLEYLPICECVNECVHERVNDCVIECVHEWVNECVNRCVNECVDECVNKCDNECVNE